MSSWAISIVAISIVFDSIIHPISRILQARIFCSKLVIRLFVKICYWCYTMGNSGTFKLSLEVFAVTLWTRIMVKPEQISHSLHGQLCLTLSSIGWMEISTTEILFCGRWLHWLFWLKDFNWVISVSFYTKILPHPATSSIILWTALIIHIIPENNIARFLAVAIASALEKKTKKHTQIRNLSEHCFRPPWQKPVWCIACRGLPQAEHLDQNTMKKWSEHKIKAIYELSTLNSPCIDSLFALSMNLNGLDFLFFWVICLIGAVIWALVNSNTPYILQQYSNVNSCRFFCYS